MTGSFFVSTLFYPFLIYTFFLPILPSLSLTSLPLHSTSYLFHLFPSSASFYLLRFSSFTCISILHYSSPRPSLSISLFLRFLPLRTTPLSMIPLFPSLLFFPRPSLFALPLYPPLLFSSSFLPSVAPLVKCLPSRVCSLLYQQLLGVSWVQLLTCSSRPR